MTPEERPRKLKRVVIKEELVELTGHWRMALILNQFLYWSERHHDFDRFIAEEQARNPESTTPLTHGWIYKSARELLNELMIDMSEVTLRRDIKLLVEQGYLAERYNPDKRWDRELQYRPDVRLIQRDLQALGYALDNYPLLLDAPFFTMKNGSFTMKNRRSTGEGSILHGEGSILHGEGAIPEITPEITSEITSENDVVAALRELGLTQKQAADAVQQHQFTLDDVARWEAWLTTLDQADNAIAVFAAAIKERRLPPRSRRRKRAPAPAQAGQQHPLALTPTDLPPTLVKVHTADGTLQLLNTCDVWQSVLVKIEEQVPRSEFDTWIKPCVLLDVEAQVAIVGTPNIFVRQEIEGRYLSILRAALEGVVGFMVEPQVVIGSTPVGQPHAS